MIHADMQHYGISVTICEMKTIASALNSEQSDGDYFILLAEIGP